MLILDASEAAKDSRLSAELGDWLRALSILGLRVYFEDGFSAHWCSPTGIQHVVMAGSFDEVMHIALTRMREFEHVRVYSS